MFQSLSRLVRRLGTALGSPVSNRSRRPGRFRLQVEALECRLAPAIILVTSNGDNPQDRGFTIFGGAGALNNPFLVRTLREAINLSNATPPTSVGDTVSGSSFSAPAPPANQIRFDLPADQLVINLG